MVEFDDLKPAHRSLTNGNPFVACRNSSDARPVAWLRDDSITLVAAEPKPILQGRNRATLQCCLLA